METEQTLAKLILKFKWIRKYLVGSISVPLDLANAGGAYKMSFWENKIFVSFLLEYQQTRFSHFNKFIF